MRYIGLDLGSRTLGVSLSDPSGIIASSHTIIRHNEEYERLIDDVKKIVDEYKVEKIVLGLPKNMNGTIGPKGELSYKFKEMLEEKLGLEVILVDERLSTVEATNLLIKNDTSRKKRKKVVDSLAATIILQSYLDKK
ncbi:MAG: Holliday junction resolvase RuvX [Bacilli bacterium]|nr:Holliday junction resolvase RuvX [Bacilli bacterium]MBR4672136.1 Holliday junction resolvase RuvX [Bacilli bacterium]